MDKTKIIAPSRMHDYYSEGGYFSTSEMVKFLSDVGFDGIDMSFENILRFDDSVRHVLYSIAKNAAIHNIELSACHLSFYMPNPDSPEFKTAYVSELKKGIDCASFMGICLAAIHPVAYHSNAHSFEDWLIKNVEFLCPVVEYANKMGVTLCIENMPSENESKTDHLYGSKAEEISLLAKIFGHKTCFDFGHANITGLDIPLEIAALSDTLGLVHVHDNDGKIDHHLVPFDGKINWRDAMSALKNSGYNGPFDLEIRTSHMPQNREKRDIYARLALMKGRLLTDMLK